MRKRLLRFEDAEDTAFPAITEQHKLSIFDGSRYRLELEKMLGDYACGVRAESANGPVARCCSRNRLVFLLIIVGQNMQCDVQTRLSARWLTDLRREQWRSDAPSKILRQTDANRREGPLGVAHQSV